MYYYYPHITNKIEGEKIKQLVEGHKIDMGKARFQIQAIWQQES